MAQTPIIARLRSAFAHMALKNPPAIRTPVEVGDAFIAARMDPVRKRARRQPPGMEEETRLFDFRAWQFDTVRKGTFIDDREIYAVILRPEEFNRRQPHECDIIYGRTPYKRAVVQQVGTRGCAAACSAMMYLDYRLSPDWRWMKMCELDNDDDVMRDLRRVGFHVEFTPLLPVFGTGGDPVAVGHALEHLLASYHAGIVGIGGEIGGHYIMLDYFSREADLAVIRDPFHGWSLVTSAVSIMKRRPELFIGAVLPPR